jgi:acetyl-CoA carboxylase biotin carboxyl carrier protein
MALSDDDVREILRLIDESELEELRIETDGFSLHVRRSAEPEAPPPAAPSADGLQTIEAPMPGTFYRAERP